MHASSVVRIERAECVQMLSLDSRRWRNGCPCKRAWERFCRTSRGWSTKERRCNVINLKIDGRLDGVARGRREELSALTFGDTACATSQRMGKTARIQDAHLPGGSRSAASSSMLPGAYDSVRYAPTLRLRTLTPQAHSLGTEPGRYERSLGTIRPAP